MALSKFKLNALVVSTTAGGMAVMGGWPPLPLAEAGGVLVGTLLCGASAAASNGLAEVELDRLMARTRRRPLVTGFLSEREALVFSVGAGAAGGGLLLACANPTTAALGVLTILGYRFVYTPLKTRSVWNTHVGAVVGAVPPVMGCTAVGGLEALWSAPSVLTFGSLFFWQMSHFMAIQWRHREDYARAGFRMLSRYDPTGSATARWAVLSSLGLATVPFVSYYAGVTSGMFIVDGGALNAGMVYLSAAFMHNRSEANAMRLFFYSILYMVPFMACFFAHAYSKAHLTDGDEESTGSGGGGTGGGGDATNLERATHLRGRKACAYVQSKEAAASAAAVSSLGSARL